MASSTTRRACSSLAAVWLDRRNWLVNASRNRGGMNRDAHGCRQRTKGKSRYQLIQQSPVAQPNAAPSPFLIQKSSQSLRVSKGRCKRGQYLRLKTKTVMEL